MARSRGVRQEHGAILLSWFPLTGVVQANLTASQNSPKICFQGPLQTGQWHKEHGARSLLRSSQNRTQDRCKGRKGLVHKPCREVRAAEMASKGQGLLVGGAEGLDVAVGDVDRGRRELGTLLSAPATGHQCKPQLLSLLVLRAALPKLSKCYLCLLGRGKD